MNKGSSILGNQGDGWRVLKKSGVGANGGVTLVSSGTCFQMGGNGFSYAFRRAALKAVDDFCRANFKVEGLAADARSMKAGSGERAYDGDLEGFDNQSNLVNIGCKYCLATPGLNDRSDRATLVTIDDFRFHSDNIFVPCQLASMCNFVTRSQNEQHSR